MSDTISRMWNSMLEMLGRRPREITTSTPKVPGNDTISRIDNNTEHEKHEDSQEHSQSSIIPDYEYINRPEIEDLDDDNDDEIQRPPTPSINPNVRVKIPRVKQTRNSLELPLSEMVRPKETSQETITTPKSPSQRLPILAEVPTTPSQENKNVIPTVPDIRIPYHERYVPPPITTMTPTTQVPPRVVEPIPPWQIPYDTRQRYPRYTPAYPMYQNDPLEFVEDDAYLPPSQPRPGRYPEDFRPFSPPRKNPTYESQVKQQYREPKYPPPRRTTGIPDETLPTHIEQKETVPTTSTMTSRNPAITVSPPRFHGQDWPTYILRFEACAELNGWTDDDKAKILPTCLEGDTVLAIQSKRSKNWSYDRLVKELNIRYGYQIDVDEIERQLRETRQGKDETYSAYYDHLYSLALKLNEDDETTDKITLKAFKAGLFEPGLRSYLVQQKPSDIGEAYHSISEWEAMSRAAQPFPRSPRVSEINKHTCNGLGNDSGNNDTQNDKLITEMLKKMSQHLDQTNETMIKQQTLIENSRVEIETLKNQIQTSPRRTRTRGRGRGNYSGNRPRRNEQNYDYNQDVRNPEYDQHPINPTLTKQNKEVPSLVNENNTQTGAKESLSHPEPPNTQNNPETRSDQA